MGLCKTMGGHGKRAVVVLLTLMMLLPVFSGCAKAQTDAADSAVTDRATAGDELSLATIITSSDYQSSGTFMTFRILLDVIKEAGVPTPDCALFGGDYSITTETDPDDCIRRLCERLAGVYPEFDPSNAVFVQGNHDNLSGALTPTGAHDFGAFVVYSINEDDFPSGQKAAQVEQTLKELDDFLSGMVRRKDFRPVIVATHLPLHDSARADNAFGGALAEVLNLYGHTLDIIYLFGHNHSGTYDDSIGGSVNYIANGESLYVPVPAQGDSGRVADRRKITISFTCMNYGYVGYSNNTAGGISTNALTLGVIQIYPESIEITRYTAEGEYCRYSIPLQNKQTAKKAA